MQVDESIRRCRALHRLHQGPELLILPNVWDPLGALLLASLGYPAVATASAAVSYARGHDDGENLPFDDVVDVTGRIAAVVEIPLTVDIERGYAASPQGVADRARRVLEAGAAGVNIEDSLVEGGALRPVDEQCDRIAALRAMARSAGVPLFINARVDVFMQPASSSPEDRLAAAVERGHAYVEAGADGLYPIGLANLEQIRAFVEAAGVPVNIYARQGVPGPGALRQAGVRRLSLGPNLLRAAVEAMRRVALDLRGDSDYALFGPGIISSDEIADLTRRRG